MILIGLIGGLSLLPQHAEEKTIWRQHAEFGLSYDKRCTYCGNPNTANDPPSLWICSAVTRLTLGGFPIIITNLFQQINDDDFSDKIAAPIQRAMKIQQLTDYTDVLCWCGESCVVLLRAPLLLLLHK